MIERAVAFSVIMTGVIALASPALGQVERPAKLAPKPQSLSNSKKAIAKPKPSTKPLVSATQEELPDAILGSALEDLYEQADEHFHHGEYNHSINIDRFIVEGDPKNLDCFSNGAYLLWSIDRNDEALALLKQGAELNPSSYYMSDELGRHLLLQNKNPTAALPYLQKAVKFECPFFTWNSLATCYEKLNQWDKAVETWTKAAKYVNNPVASRRLENARKKLAGLK